MLLHLGPAGGHRPNPQSPIFQTLDGDEHVLTASKSITSGAEKSNKKNYSGESGNESEREYIF
jgi:hypothetical protein